MTTRSHCPITPLHRILFLVLCQAMVLPSFVTIGLAQTVTTNVTSSGSGTTINDAGTTQNIRGGTLSTSNLFHSFGEFSIASGDSAVFQNLNGAGTDSMVADGATVSNIVGRVTGANPSNIFGLINSSGGFPNANLFLINPSGIVFGPTAALNVGGSVHFSTADYLRFGTGSEVFYADLGKTSTLSSQPVTAFGFLGSNPAGTILVQGGTVNNASTLTFVGRDLVDGSGNTITPGIAVTGGTLSNPSGQIRLASVKSPHDAVAGGELRMADLSPDPTLGFAMLGSVRLTGGATVTTSGITGGSIFLRGGKLVMDGAATSLQIVTGSGNSGGVDISMADSVQLLGPNTGVPMGIFTRTSGSGTGGDIQVSAPSIEVLGIGEITADSDDQGGDAGDIVVQGSGLNGTVTIAPSSPTGIVGGRIESSASGSGAPGTVLVTATKSISLTAGSVRSFSNLAGGGEVKLSAPTISFNADVNGNPTTIITRGFSTGRAGDIVVEATGANGTFTLNSGELEAATTSTGNEAGNISVTAGKEINISSKGLITAQVNGQGKSGVISISAPTVTINGGAITTKSTSINQAATGGSIMIEADNFNVSNGGSITAESTGPANAGSVTIQGIGSDGTRASSIVLNNAILSTEAIEGAGGSIVMRASGPLSLTNSTVSATVSGGTDPARPPANVTIASGAFNMTGGSITAETGGAATGGTITATGSDFSMSNGAKISTSSTSADPQTAGTAGNIGLKSASDLTIANSTVTTQAAQASGGDIKLAAPGTILLNNAKIISSVNGPAGSNGGNISIDPQFVILSNGSQILAQAVGGNGGNINIVTNTFLAEPGTLINASSSLGVSGQVAIQSPIQNLAGAIAPLPQSFVSLASLYGQHCAGQKGGQFSSFVQGQRDGLPAQPGDFLSSPLSQDLISRDLRSQDQAPAHLAAVRLGLIDSVSFSHTALGLTSGCRS